ncbi:hypothetical protein HDK77DRAFT_63000 [Phyllosticta capitalensis]
MVLPGDRPRQYKSLPRPPLGAITSLSSALHPPRCLSRCLSTSATDDSARCRPWYCRAIAHASTKDLHRPSASIPRRLVHRLHLLSTPLSRRPSTNAMAGTSLSQTRRWVNQVSLFSSCCMRDLSVACLSCLHSTTFSLRPLNLYIYFASSTSTLSRSSFLLLVLESCLTSFSNTGNPAPARVPARAKFNRRSSWPLLPPLSLLGGAPG